MWRQRCKHGGERYAQTRYRSADGKKARMGMLLDVAAVERLRAIAWHQRRPLNELINEALEEKLVALGEEVAGEAVAEYKRSKSS